MVEPPASLRRHRTLKLVAVGYLLKTLLIGIAWLAIPDLPGRAMGAAQKAWAWVAEITP